jgi:uncharacterized membrane protein
VQLRCCAINSRAAISSQSGLLAHHVGAGTFDGVFLSGILAVLLAW